jgi:hypothetical protein
MIHFSMFKNFKLRTCRESKRITSSQNLFILRYKTSFNLQQSIVYSQCMYPRSGTCEDILERQLMMANLGRNILCYLSI